MIKPTQTVEFGVKNLQGKRFLSRCLVGEGGSGVHALLLVTYITLKKRVSFEMKTKRGAAPEIWISGAAI